MKNGIHCHFKVLSPVEFTITNRRQVIGTGIDSIKWIKLVRSSQIPTAERVRNYFERILLFFREGLGLVLNPFVQFFDLFVVRFAVAVQ